MSGVMSMPGESNLDKDRSEEEHSPLPSMSVNSDDMVRETISRHEYWTHKGVGRLDDHEILVVAKVSESGPTITVHAGGELEHWKHEDWDDSDPVYVGGTSVSRSFDTVRQLDEKFGELYREYDLELIDIPEEVNDAE